MKRINNCQLEVDEERGVAYVHDSKGRTLLRVCQIPQLLARREFIDVVFSQELNFYPWLSRKGKKVDKKGGERK